MTIGSRGIPEAAASLRKRNLHRLCSLFKLENSANFGGVPSLGTTLYLTNHDKAITFEGQPYTTAVPNEVTAHRGQTQGGEGSRDIIGAFDTSVLDVQQFVQGHWEGAEITEYVIDWRFPFAGALQIRRYVLGRTLFDEDKYTVTVRNFADKLSKPRGRTFDRMCDTTFGSGRCMRDITGNGPYRVQNVRIDSVSDDTTLLADTGDLVPGVDNQYRYGFIEFVSGLNGGRKYVVKSYASLTRTIALAHPPAHPLLVGDRFDIVDGCDKLRVTCSGTFGNFVNYQAFPFVPGSDRNFETPESA